MKANNVYASMITKDYLKYLGIDFVSEDGQYITKNGKLLHQTENAAGYMYITLYDSSWRQLYDKKDRTNSTGERVFGVHRIVYAWYNNVIPEGMVIDHKDNDKKNNHKDNLQLLTPSGNIWKDKVCNVRQEKCKLNKPRKFYEDKLEKYLALYKEAKINRDQELAHKLRANIANTKARLRYYDNNCKEE